MRLVPSLTVTVLTAASLLAQHQDPSTLVTATDYGIATKTATSSSQRISGKGSKIQYVLWLGAHAGSAAWISTTVSKTEMAGAGRGVRVKEKGQAGGSYSGAASGGTIAGSTTKIGTPHAVLWRTPLELNAKGTLTVTWSGSATNGGVATATVTANGKEVASFTAADKAVTKTFQVTADSKGVAILVTTSGAASGTSTSKATYAATVGAFFKSATTSSRCTFKSQGFPCNSAGRLFGSARGLSMTMSLSGARPNTTGVIFLGRLETPGLKLPGGGCTLRVFNIPLLIKTGAHGSASRTFDVPANVLPISFSAQGGLVWTNTSKQIRIGTSNTVTASCVR